MTTIGWRDNTNRGFHSDLMTLWLKDDQLNTLQPKFSILARGFDGLAQKGPPWLKHLMIQWVEVTNDEMTEKATIQIRR